MEIKYKKVMVEQTLKKYVADDGTEFNFEQDCKCYEEKMIQNKKIQAAENLRIKKLDEVVPISIGGEVNSDNIFIWYRIANEQDLETILEAYASRYGYVEVGKPGKYPNVLCIETIGHEEYEDSSYGYWFDQMINDTKIFWKKLGYNVLLEKENNILDQ